MKILVIGSGGREHAICWKLSESRYKPEILCAPGNAGISKIAECIPIKATQLDEIVSYSINNSIDIVFVAPDDPLAMGLVDRLTENGIRAFGPTRKAARIEASKSFAKALMKKYGIPTAEYEVFENKEKAFSYIENLKPPIVIKADGLALGKGVIIAESKKQAKSAVEDMLSGKSFGDSGKKVIIEQFLTGSELTVLAFTDGNTIIPMPDSRDHKKALDGDKGLNTGGMGAISPGANMNDSIKTKMMNEIFIPTIEAMKKEGRPFKGVIYFGLMLTEDGPKVIEYNARFGDPEAQAVLLLLKTDLVDIVNAVIDEKLDGLNIEWSDKASCCIVAASGGYPVAYKKGYPIEGLESVDSLVFHAGTAWKNEQVVTNGGRVLGITALGNTLDEAIKKAYDDIKKINFKDMHFRTDIGNKR